MFVGLCIKEAFCAIPTLLSVTAEASGVVSAEVHLSLEGTVGYSEWQPGLPSCTASHSAIVVLRVRLEDRAEPQAISPVISYLPYFFLFCERKMCSLYHLICLGPAHAVLCLHALVGCATLQLCIHLLFSFFLYKVWPISNFILCSFLRYFNNNFKNKV